MASVRQLSEPNRKTGKRPWVVEYTDREGRRRRATPKSGLKRDADALRLKIEMEVEQGVHIARADALTVGELAERYIRYIEDKRNDGRVGRTHYDQTRGGIDRSIRPHLGNVLVTEITTVLLEDWYRKMVAVDGLSPTTARVRVHLLRSIEAFAIKRGYMKLSPVKDAALDLRGIRAKPIRTLNAEQVGTLLAAVAAPPAWGDMRQAALLCCYVNLAAFCGLRFGEISGLTLANLKLDRGLIEVRHNLTRFDELKCPKTPAGVRDILIPAHIAALLRSWLHTYHLRNDRDLVFRIVSGGEVSASNFHGRMWKPLLKRCGFSGPDWPHFHALRHFAASWMIENQMPVTEVASILGHSHFDMTLQTYAHPVAGGARRREAIDRLSSSLLQITHASLGADAI